MGYNFIDDATRMSHRILAVSDRRIRVGFGSCVNLHLWSHDACARVAGSLCRFQRTRFSRASDWKPRHGRSELAYRHVVHGHPSCRIRPAGSRGARGRRRYVLGRNGGRSACTSKGTTSENRGSPHQARCELQLGGTAASGPPRLRRPAPRSGRVAPGVV